MDPIKDVNELQEALRVVKGQQGNLPVRVIATVFQADEDGKPNTIIERQMHGVRVGWVDTPDGKAFAIESIVLSN